MHVYVSLCANEFPVPLDWIQPLLHTNSDSNPACIARQCQPCDHSAQLDGHTPYPSLKKASSLLVSARAHTLGVVTVRCLEKRLGYGTKKIQCPVHRCQT